jgi:hypothetical protein
MAKKKITPAKISAEELDKLQAVLKDLNAAKTKIADAELEKVAAINQLENIRQQFAVVEKELTDKYGEDISLNIQTGEIAQKENNG